MIADINMTKTRTAIKSAAVNETAVCLECHRRFDVKDLIKHANNAHANLDSVRGGDQIKTFSSIKVLHGVCQQEQFYVGNKQFLALALKLLCKTPNEAIVESMGSIGPKAYEIGEKRKAVCF